jgi:hypothetical protein
MKNIEQLRAAAALSYWASRPPHEPKGDTDALFGSLAARLLTQGLLSALALAKDPAFSEKHTGAPAIMAELGRFMASRERGLLPFGVTSLDDFIRGLTNHPSSLLQQATAEAISYLGYLKQFRPK